MHEGSANPKILFVSDFLRTKEKEQNLILAGERRDILVNALSSAGILASEYAMTILGPDCKSIINSSPANIIVPLGEKPLEWLTGYKNINKQHLSLLPVKAEFGARKALPLLHPEAVQKSYDNSAYIRFGAMRLKEEKESTQLVIPKRKFLLSLDMDFDAIVSYLEDIIVKNAREISTDIETGNGFVNTVGLAISPYEAIVVECGPNRWNPVQFHKLWSLFKLIWESENIGKIAQNAAFEAHWASLYGIQFNNVSFDTMLAMKFLHPTLERGLDNVGRIYTSYPYWKDDHSDWNNVRDWRSHLNYCGKDCTGQFMAKVNMEGALKARGMLDSFTNFIMPQVPIAHEMMMRGLRLDSDMLITLREKTERDIQAITDSFDRQCEERLGKKVNLNSPKQVKEAFKTIGLKIPTSKGKETVSKAALLKLKNKYPKEMLIKDMLKIEQLRKNTEDYLNFESDPDGRVRFSYDLASDENGLWVGKKTIFDRGFDPTMVPQIVKNCIVADEGKVFVQIRLNQPELRYIAQDAPDYKLKAMLDQYKDIGKYMAGKLFRKHEDMVNRNEIKIAQQVIKSANEMDAPKQFVEKCFAKAQVLYSDLEAKRFMQIYFEEFSGCRRRIDRIRKEIYNKRSLSSPSRQITYYDRINDSLIRRALSWGPESASNDEISGLCMELHKYAEVEFVCRNQNSLLVQIPNSMDLMELGSVLPMQVGNRWGSLENV